MSKVLSKSSSLNLKKKNPSQIPLNKLTNESKAEITDLFKTYNKELRSCDKRFKRNFITKVDMTVDFLAIGEIGE
jgi:hypothetical protein